METYLKIFKALSDANRLRILRILASRPLCVCEITAILGLAISTVSKHLNILREAGLVNFDKKGKWVDYRLTTQYSDPAISRFITEIINQLESDPRIQVDLHQTQSVDRLAICPIKACPSSK